MKNSPLHLMRPRRSVLYVPADNVRAIEKSLTLPADCIIYDLEDAVAPEMKAIARENLRAHFLEHPNSLKERTVRINELDSEWGTEDLMCARACGVDAIVVPKVNLPSDVMAVSDMLDETDALADMRIFAMIETARGVLNCADIAELGHLKHSRLSSFIIGMNDLISETNIGETNARQTAHSWLMQIILAARAGGLHIIDAVYNDFRNLDGFTEECKFSADIGFDGKSLIHPTQIEAANLAYMPSESSLKNAKSIVDAFELPENADKGVINLAGKMIERLHLERAQALIAKFEFIRRKAN